MKRLIATTLALSLFTPMFAAADTIEYLQVNPKAPSNKVRVSPTTNTVMEENVLAIEFVNKFRSKKSAAGETVSFTNKQAVYTTDGTLVIPANSTFNGTVLDITAPKWFNRNAQVFMLVDKITYPDGRSFSLNAKPFTKNNALKESPWMNVGKVALSTVTLGIIGTGIGVGFSFIPNPAKIGTGIAAGVATGAGVGFLVGLVSKGLNYNAKAGEEIFVILLEDAALAR
jgi:hypothetical protein